MDGQVVCDLDRVDWSASSSVAVSAGARTGLGWAREVFEQAPGPVRIFLRLSWRWLLLIRLGPDANADFVLGWRILAHDDERVVLGSQSRWGLDTRLALTTTGDNLALDTAIRFTARRSRLLWLVVAPIHRMIVRGLLMSATRRTRGV